jgi:hypothetical protein
MLVFAAIVVISEQPGGSSHIGPAVGLASLREPGANVLSVHEAFCQPVRKFVRPI